MYNPQKAVAYLFQKENESYPYLYLAPIGADYKVGSTYNTLGKCLVVDVLISNPYKF